MKQFRKDLIRKTLFCLQSDLQKRGLFPHNYKRKKYFVEQIVEHEILTRKSRLTFPTLSVCLSIIYLSLFPFVN